MSAKFIVIEGLDGSGKTTQLRLLGEKLRALGRQVAETAEPTTSATGGLVRDALSGFTPRSGAEIAALFMADRVAHNANPIWGIRKLLADGKDVLCDRYYYSSLAYQGMVTDPEWVARINLTARRSAGRICACFWMWIMRPAAGGWTGTGPTGRSTRTKRR